MADPTIEYRVEQLESKVCEVGTDVKLIMRNHLPHIQARVDLNGAKIDTNSTIFKELREDFKTLSNKIVGAAISIIVAIILSALLS